MGNIGSLSIPFMESPPINPPVDFTSAIEGYYCTPINLFDAVVPPVPVNNLCARAWKDGDKQFAQAAFLSFAGLSEEDIIVFKANGRSMDPIVLNATEGFVYILPNDPQSFPVSKNGAQVQRVGTNIFLPQWFIEEVPGAAGAFVWAESVAYYFGVDEVKVGVMGEISLESEGVEIENLF